MVVADPEPVEVITEPRRAQAMLHPARLEILEHLGQPGSAAALARRLDLPRQRVNYHLRELESQRLVECVEERTKGSVTERIYRRTGQAYAISTEALGRLGTTPEAVQDRFSSAYQVALASRAIRDITVQRKAAGQSGRRLPTLALETEVRFASPQARAEFTEELTEAIARLVAKHHDATAPQGRSFRFYLGAYPRPR